MTRRAVVRQHLEAARAALVRRDVGAAVTSLVAAQDAARRLPIPSGNATRSLVSRALRWARAATLTPARS